MLRKHSARDMNIQIQQPSSVALTSSIFARRYDVPGRYSPFVKWERFERHRFSGGDHRQKWSLERYSPPVKACSLVFAVITGALERSNYGFPLHFGIRILLPVKNHRRDIYV